MATFAELKSAVADDLARSDLTTSIATAINDAISTYSAERFWFNVSRSTTFNLVSAQATYTSTDNAAIPRIMRPDLITLTDGSQKYEMSYVSAVELELADNMNVANNRPTMVARFGTDLKFWPTPNKAYPCRIVGWVKPIDLSADSDTNEFSLYAAKLIRHEAARDVAQNKIRNFDLAQAAAANRDMEYSRLKQETVMKLGGSDVIIPTDF